MERAQYIPRLNAYRIALSLIWALHFFGLLGLFWSPMNEGLRWLTPFSSFLSLTPLNLSVLGLLLIAFHPKWTGAQQLWLLASACIGYGVEVLGVHTGAIFGEYRYGPVLGWQVAEVPLLMGVNWFVLVYTSGAIVSGWKVHKAVKAAGMATLMTALDFLIEPVAIYWNFWQWGQPSVPLQNYLAWWGIAFGLAYAWQRAFSGKINPLAVHIWWAQVSFFLVNNLLIFI